MAVKTNVEIGDSKYFRITVTVGKDAEGKLIRKTFYGKTKKEAEGKKDDYLQAIKRGLAIDFDKMILGDLMHIWLFEILLPSEMKPKTFDRYESLYRCHIKSGELNSTRLYEIRSTQVQRYYNTLYDSGVTSKTIKSVHKLLRYFFNYCIQEDYIVKNPCFKLNIPGSIAEKTTEEINPFYDEELIEIKEALRSKAIESAALLTLGTGIREGELFGLRFMDIDIRNKELNIKQDLEWAKVFERDGTYEYKAILQPPKTKNAIRTIPIPSALIPMLQSHIRLQKEKLLKNGLSYSADKLVFTTESCNCFDNRNFLRAWQRVLKKTGVEYRNFHTLRHTYATKLFENGIPLKTVSMLLGHANIKITADTYTHVMPKVKIEAAETLNALFC